MKKLFIAFIALAFMGTNAFSQKFAYVDSEYILGQMPEYRSAQKQLDDLLKDICDNITKKMGKEEGDTYRKLLCMDENIKEIIIF